MRQEDKQIDGPELERAEARKRENELVEEPEDELYDLDGRPERSVDSTRSAGVTSAMRAILEGDELSIDALDVEPRHRTALSALRTAVEGTDPQLARFVYAEDRRQLLEQALAVLQPELANLDTRSDEFHALLHDVAELREDLDELEDAEDEIEEFHRAHKVEAASEAGDRDDDDREGDGDDKGSDGAVADGAAPLRGQRTGEVKPRRGERSRDRATSTATATARGAGAGEPGPGSSLEGPEPATTPERTTTLGDPAEIAHAASVTRSRGG